MSLLETLIEISRLVEEHQNPQKMLCLHGYVVRHGTSFPYRSLPSHIPRMELKECFSNSLELIQSFPELIYCEGYASCVVPIHHAWCIDSDGYVVDPTWLEESAVNAEYIGVPMDTDFVINYVCNRGYYGVLDDWQNRFPILSGKYDISDVIHERYANQITS